MKIKSKIIDTFTEVAFKGNATPVCLLEHEIEYTLMHHIAKEFNLPVTAFVLPLENGNLYAIRYFTVTGEIPACGHATLASAKAIFDSSEKTSINFITQSGVNLIAQREGEIIYLTYPQYDAEPYIVDKPILENLGINNYQNAFFCEKLETLFIMLEDASILRSVCPNYPNLIKSSEKIKEVVITSLSDKPEYDFFLRSFCPWIGIDEDPVTGSIHSFLTPYWSNILHKNNMVAYQASQRGGIIYVKSEENSVILGGKAYPFSEGFIYI